MIHFLPYLHSTHHYSLVHMELGGIGKGARTPLTGTDSWLDCDGPLNEGLEVPNEGARSELDGRETEDKFVVCPIPGRIVKPRLETAPIPGE